MTSRVLSPAYKRDIASLARHLSEVEDSLSASTALIATTSSGLKARVTALVGAAVEETISGAPNTRLIRTINILAEDPQTDQIIGYKIGQIGVIKGEYGAFGHIQTGFRGCGLAFPIKVTFVKALEKFAASTGKSIRWAASNISDRNNQEIQARWDAIYGAGGLLGLQASTRKNAPPELRPNILNIGPNSKNVRQIMARNPGRDLQFQGISKKRNGMKKEAARLMRVLRSTL